MQIQIFMNNYSLEKTQDCAEMCGMNKFRQNLNAENVKMCGKYPIVRKDAENVKLCDSAPTAPKRCLWLQYLRT